MDDDDEGLEKAGDGAVHGDEWPTMFAPAAGAADRAEPLDVVEDEPDDDEDKPKKMATSTKLVLVAAVWVLFTLFLVGRFSQDKPDTVSTRFDPSQGFDDGGTPDVIDTPEEEAADLNGDGVLDDQELAAAVEELASAGEEGSAGDGASAGDPGGAGGPSGGSYEATPTDAPAPPAVPGVAPAGATTTTAGGDGGGNTATTTAPKTTTTSKPGGGTSTTTTTAGGGGGATTTAPPGVPVDITVTAKNFAYGYPTGYAKDLVVPRGSRITFDNIEISASVDHSFTINGGWNSGTIDKNDGPRTSPDLLEGTYSYHCNVHDWMNGTITVT